MCICCGLLITGAQNLSFMGKPPSRVRYNAKARGSVAGGSLKRGKPKKQDTTGSDRDDVESNVDSNMDMVIPPSSALEDERILLWKEALKAEVNLESLSSPSCGFTLLHSLWPTQRTTCRPRKRRNLRVISFVNTPIQRNEDKPLTRLTE